MLLGGDEFSRTQQGNNNAYCQDNEISWVDWSLLKEHKDLYAFTRQAIKLRKRSPALHQGHFLESAAKNDLWPSIQWFGPNNQDPDWDHGKTIACLINEPLKAQNGTDHNELYIIFNADFSTAEYDLPQSKGGEWNIILNTQEKKPVYKRTQKKIEAEPFSLHVLGS